MTQTSLKQPQNGRKALVLSGGSVRGAFQAGALAAVLKNGFEPDIIQGISAGALNAAFICNEAGKVEGNPNWELAGQNLQKIWSNEIRKPRDIIRKRAWLSIFFQIISRNFKGIYDPAPLKRLLNEHVREFNIKQNPATLLLGAVDLLGGEIKYKTQVNDRLIDFIIASSSMPIFFPPVNMEKKLFYDGGIRDNAPLRHVIQAGADEIILILTQPDPIEKKVLGNTLKSGRVLDVGFRTVDILLNDVLVNDLKELQRINQDLNSLEPCLTVSPSSSLHGKKVIKFKVIRPEKSYKAKINNFKQANIHEMLIDGYDLGLQALYTPFETGISKEPNPSTYNKQK